MSQLYADVIVDISIAKLDRSFQYKVPDELREKIRDGSKVRVPFGKGSRLTDGYVIGMGYEPKCDESIIKYIESCPDNYITAEERLIRLAAWIRMAYGSTFIQALKTVLPVKQKKKRRKAANGVNSNTGGNNTDLDGIGEYATETGIDLIGIVNEATETGTAGVYESKIILNEEQIKVYDGIKKEFSGKKRPCLIRGVTGSGKTHIYMRLIADAFKDGKQAILLIPEISLTWQTVSRFYEQFGDRAAVLHSRMSMGEKSDLLDKVKSGDVRLVIGPRSALFTPFDDLGLIIIDEEHDTSYQSEQTPRYHAREVAQERASLEDARLVLGSATPSLEARFRCDTGEYVLFELENRFEGAKLPDVIISDMRDELTAGRRTIIGKRLGEEIANRLERKEQVMLFLNKRGHTGLYTCRSCGNVLKCPHCDIALTYHSNGLLMCHYCGYTHPMVKLCPSCGSPYIGGFKVGTQQVEQTVKKMFPSASVIRMDRDTTTKKDSHEELLKTFASGEADILIGTQMIVKGHDFPKVTLVGVLDADTALYAGDFRSSERAYQLIVQAVGRAGRGRSEGCGIIQTYNPENPVIQAAARQDYEAFYEDEKGKRSLMNYPPAGCIMTIHGAMKDEQYLLNAMEHIKKYVSTLGMTDISILGPTPEAVSKLRDSYRIAVYIKCRNLSDMVKIRRHVEKYIEINSGFKDISIQFASND